MQGYGDGNMRLRSTFSLQYGHVCFLPTMHQPRIQNSWNLTPDVKLASHMQHYRYTNNTLQASVP